MKDFWVEPEQKKVNKKKVIISIIIAIVLIIFITITIIYANNKNVRDWIDKNIFQKEKTQNQLSYSFYKQSNLRLFFLNT